LQACCDFLHIQRPWKVRQRALHQLRIFFKSIAHIRKDARRMPDRKGDGEIDCMGMGKGVRKLEKILE
jgi:hypothetical protein